MLIFELVATGGCNGSIDQSENNKLLLNLLNER